MRIGLKLAAGVALLSALTAPALASTPGWYIGGEAGASFLNDSDDSVQGTPQANPGAPATPSGCTVLVPGLLCLLPTPGAPGGSPTASLPKTNFGTEYDTGWLGGLTLGYLFDSGLRLELEARYAKNDIDKVDFSGSGSTSGSGDIKNTSLMVNAWYDFNNHGSWHPYIGGGIGAAQLDYSNDNIQLTSGNFSDKDIVFAYQGGAGLAFDLTDRLTADLGYRYFATDDPSYEDSGFSVDSEYAQNVAMLSLRYTFAPSKRPDADNDGVPDYLDKCPNTPAGVQVGADGCPIDNDGDGVPNDQDQCPNTPKGIQVDDKGCPLDSDGDGVPDYKDKCPNTPAGTKVDSKGCPLVVDSDGDGVPDDQDQCPNTPEGVAVLTNGCAVGQSAVLEGVKFNFNKATLTSNAKVILKDVIKTLKDSPGFNVEIAGYTDSIGSDSYNQGLSQRRADSVKRYLVDNGVDSTRLTTKGHGENDPIASNDTDAGRAKNRRVELNVVSQQ